MIYLERDTEGKIIALRREYTPGMECKQFVDNEILEFLGHQKTDDAVLQMLAATDVGIMRILEDLINLLISKNIIMSTELPEEAQNKLQQRQQIRRKIGRETLIVDDII